MEIPKLIYKNGYLRVLLPNGEMLPETSLTVDNDCTQTNQALVTVQFLCEIDLKENK